MLNRILKRGPEPAKVAKANTAGEINARLDELGRDWMYGFDFGEGVSVSPYTEYLAESHETRLQMLEPELRRTFDGRWDSVSVLDLACNEGWWSFQVARMGAAQVTGLDARDFNVDRANFVKAQTGADNVTFGRADAVAFDPAEYGTFDLVLCLGLLYHVENPMGLLRRLRSVTRELCVIETEVARPTTITVDRGPADGLLTTEHAFAIASEPYYRDNSIASVTGVSLIPTLATLVHLLEAVGFKDVKKAEAIPGGAERYITRDRVMLFARV